MKNTMEKNLKLRLSSWKISHSYESRLPIVKVMRALIVAMASAYAGHLHAAQENSYFPIEAGSWWLYSTTAPVTVVTNNWLFGTSTDSAITYLDGKALYLNYNLIGTSDGWSISSVVQPLLCGQATYNPPMYFLPREIIPTSLKTTSSTFNCTAPAGSGNGSYKVEFLGFETITVPAGTFENALHVRTTSNGTYTITEEGWPHDPSSSSVVEDAWLVKGVGKVKSVNSGDSKSLIWQLLSSSRLKDNELVEDGEHCDASKFCGDPINYANGNSFQRYVDISNAVSGRSFVLSYNSRAPQLGPLGYGWSHTFSHQAQLIPSKPKQMLILTRPDGKRLTFKEPATITDKWIPSESLDYVAQPTVDNSLPEDQQIKLIVKTPRNEIEVYNYNGELQELVDIRGISNKVAWETTERRISTVTDTFGRQIEFQYNADGLIESIKDRHGTIQASYQYDSKRNLVSRTNAASDTHVFKYELAPDKGEGAADTHRMTEYIGESGKKIASWKYDSAGRALESANALGVKDASIVYGAGAARVVDSSGQSTNVTFSKVASIARPTSFDSPSRLGITGTHSRRGYDTRGNVLWSEDFNNVRRCAAFGSVRNLEVVRVSGLAKDAACTVTSDGAVLPAGSRKTSTQWHPVWRLATKVAEPRRLTTKVYNGQPDPFNGGAIASCVLGNTTLPDGSPIVVLCKQVEQATTDANGAQGFAAAVETNVPARVEQWTYNQYGQVLTAKDPLGNTTTNAYYPDTSADHTMGDLATVNNALNQKTTYTKYNPAGQWLEMKDANGVVTTRAFDLRQRLTSSSTAGLTTSYDYWPTGLLKTVTLPDTSAVNYGYDDAHRLTSVTDNLGNKITYTLDNSGNRIGENVTDPAGKLAKTLTRVPDALNRIQQVTGRE